MRVYDEEYIEELKAETWQVNLLKLNPSYVYWGNHEDYMSNEKGWSARFSCPSIDDIWELDDLNEVVNFYFTVSRDNHECPKCEGANLNKATKQLADDWYDFDNTGRRWCSALTEVEVEALVKAGRISDLLDGWYRYDEENNIWLKNAQDNSRWLPSEPPVMPSPEKVNEWNEGRGVGHDDINRSICVKARAKHLGIYGHCDCEVGYIYDADKARVSLQLWMIHPIKGCSKGILIEEIKQKDLPKVFAYLKEAADRNANRFSKIPEISKEGEK